MKRLLSAFGRVRPRLPIARLLLGTALLGLAGCQITELFTDHVVLCGEARVGCRS